MNDCLRPKANIHQFTYLAQYISNNETNWYGSNFSGEDWDILQRLVNRHCVFKDGEFIPPVKIEIGDIPPHLADTEIVQQVMRYRETGDEKHLSKAGSLLAPDHGDNWWHVVSKGYYNRMTAFDPKRTLIIFSFLIVHTIYYIQ